MYLRVFACFVIRIINYEAFANQSGNGRRPKAFIALKPQLLFFMDHDIVFCFCFIKLKKGNIRWQATKKFKSEKAHKAVEEAELELGLLIFPMAILVG